MNEGDSRLKDISSEEIENLITKLFMLEICGSVIKDCLKVHKDLQRAAHSYQKEISCDTKSLKSSGPAWAKPFEKLLYFFS